MVLEAFSLHFTDYCQLISGTGLNGWEILCEYSCSICWVLAQSQIWKKLKKVSILFSYAASVHNSFPGMSGIFPSRCGMPSDFREPGSEFGMVKSCPLQPYGVASHGCLGSRFDLCWLSKELETLDSTGSTEFSFTWLRSCMRFSLDGFSR